MKMLPTIAGNNPIFSRLTTNSATADAKIAASSESNTVGQSYSTGTGSRNVSMPTQCIAQMPMPMAVAPPLSQSVRATPRAEVTPPARSSAAYDAIVAISADTTTRR